MTTPSLYIRPFTKQTQEIAKASVDGDDACSRGWVRYRRSETQHLFVKDNICAVVIQGAFPKPKELKVIYMWALMMNTGMEILDIYCFDLEPPLTRKLLKRRIAQAKVLKGWKVIGA